MKLQKSMSLLVALGKVLISYLNIWVCSTVALNDSGRVSTVRQKGLKFHIDVDENVPMEALVR